MTSRELLLLRHAKSDWDSKCSDFERPLNARGRRDAKTIGRWLHAQDLHPDAVYCSPARRAAETVQAFCAATGIAVDSIIWSTPLYLASLDTLLETLSQIPSTKHRVMLIGHNPGLEELLQFLSADAGLHAQRGKLLTTATIARLSVPPGWGKLTRHCATLEQFVRPRDLSPDADA